MLPTLREVLGLPPLAQAKAVVRAGEAGLDAPVRWVHVTEIDDIAGLLEGGELILTTGIALPSSAAGLRGFVASLAHARVCGLIVELGRRYRRSLPAALVAGAQQAGLPLIELHRETPFVAVTQAVHTRILDARVRELVASDERQRHRTLLTALVSSTVPLPELVERSSDLGLPLAGRVITGVAVRLADARGPAATADAFLHGIVTRIADTLRALRVPVLVSMIDEHHLAAVFSVESDARTDAVLQRVYEAVRTSVGVPGGSRVVMAAGTTAAEPDGAAASLREAVRVVDTAASLPERHGWFRASGLRLHGLVHELRDSVALRDYVDGELGPLVGRPDAERMTQVLSAYCRAGGNKTAAATALFMSRASLYDWLAKLGRALRVDLGDADVVTGLHFALIAREALTRPDVVVAAEPRDRV